MGDVVLALSIFPVFELAVVVLLAVKLQMSPGFGQFLFAMLLFGSRLMFHQCDWCLVAHPHHQSLEWHLLLLIVLVTA